MRIKSRRRQKVVTRLQERREKLSSYLNTGLRLLAVGLVVGIITFLLFAEQFQIQSLAVYSKDVGLAKRVTEAATNELNQYSYYIPNTNQFLWTSARMQQLLDNHFPGIEDYNFYIRDHELIIKIEQYPELARWCPGSVLTDKCLSINEKGRIFNRTNTNEPDTAPLIITDNKVGTPEVGDHVARKAELALYLEIKNFLADNNYELSYVMAKESEVRLYLLNKQPERVSIKTIILPLQPYERLALAAKDMALLIESNELQQIAKRESIKRFDEVDFLAKDKVFYRFTK